MDSSIFVARERELARLDGFLARAQAGCGQVCFICGEAGSGKTALVREFARRALQRYSDLVVAFGQSDAQTGAGDAYLPFRELLGQLTGDVEANLAGGTITEENAGRMRRLLRFSGQALVEVGPDLIGAFLPGAGLLTRLGAFVAQRAGWVDRLERLAGRTREETAAASAGIEQSHIFEQYTNVLRALAEKHPLLLLLDDLQWADGASIDLLFRLGRRIGESRILIVGTYRPAEVALGRLGERHPLVKVLTEFERYFGDIQVDLDQAGEEWGQKFVDAFLDSEANRLGAGFRQALCQHTEGHPLFTIELLRDMQERGDLVQDEKGHWVEGPTLDWEALPARVEGVIEERISRLEGELQELLTVASVQGEDFTAEVVAQVRAVDARAVIRRLSGELAKQHRLVSARGVQRLGAQRLSLYRFRHHLLQKYLYGGLDEAERSYMHEDVGNVLELLYGEQVDEVAVQLAFHFVEAGLDEKAVRYLRRAGEQAAARFANAEAVVHFSRALTLTTDAGERCGLLLARERLYDVQGMREAQQRDLVSLEELAELLDDGCPLAGASRRAEVALRWAHYAEATSDYTRAIAEAEAAVAAARAVQDDEREAAAYVQWGMALWRQGEYGAAQSRLEQALALACAGKHLRLVSDSLRNLGVVCTWLGDYAQAEAHCREALQIVRQIGDRQGEGKQLNNLGIIAEYRGDFAEAQTYYEQALEILRQIGDRQHVSMALINLGNVAYYQGNADRCRDYFEQALQIKQEIGDREGEGTVLGNLGEVLAEQADYARASAYLEQALQISREIGDRRGEWHLLNGLGLILTDRSDYAGARVCLEQALQICRQTGNRRGEGETLRNLGRLYLGQGDVARSEAILEAALPIIREVSDRRGESVALNTLGRAVLYAGDAELAREYSQRALQVAQDIAERVLQGYALTGLGRALVELGQVDQAGAAYREAFALRRELSQENLAIESLAGLANVSLLQGDWAEAQSQVEEILTYLEKSVPPGLGHPLDGTEEPMRVYLACYRVLQELQDPRAPGVLRTAYDWLQERAALMGSEDLRRSFLEGNPAHREIIEEWSRLI